MKLAYPVATPDTTDPTMLALRGDPAESFRLLNKLGYEGAELMVRDPGDLDPARISTLAAEFSLSIPAVSTGQLRKEDGLQLCDLNEAERLRAVARTKEVIDFAAAVGSPQINIGTLRGHLPTSPARARSLEAARESISELLGYALKKRIGIALEPQNRFVINWLNTVGEAQGWMEQCEQPNWSLLFDQYHALFEEPSVYASLIRVFPRVSHVQVADSNRMAPGSGQVNFGELIRVLRALGYQGFVSIEIVQQPNGAEAAARSAGYLLPFILEHETAAEKIY